MAAMKLPLLVPYWNAAKEMTPSMKKSMKMPIAKYPGHTNHYIQDKHGYPVGWRSPSMEKSMKMPTAKCHAHTHHNHHQHFWDRCTHQAKPPVIGQTGYVKGG
jgi:hypothetical protein